MCSYDVYYRFCWNSQVIAQKVLEYHKRGVPIDKIKNAILADEAKEKEEQNNTLSGVNTSF